MVVSKVQRERVWLTAYCPLFFYQNKHFWTKQTKIDQSWFRISFFPLCHFIFFKIWLVSSSRLYFSSFLVLSFTSEGGGVYIYIYIYLYILVMCAVMCCSCSSSVIFLHLSVFIYFPFFLSSYWVGVVQTQRSRSSSSSLFPLLFFFSSS
jgi:hypothetical protein